MRSRFMRWFTVAISAAVLPSALTARAAPIIASTAHTAGRLTLHEASSGDPPVGWLTPDLTEVDMERDHLQAGSGVQVLQTPLAMPSFTAAPEATSRKDVQADRHALTHLEHRSVSAATRVPEPALLTLIGAAVLTASVFAAIGRTRLSARL